MIHINVPVVPWDHAGPMARIDWTSVLGIATLLVSGGVFYVLLFAL
jgi:hypothetical protein